MLTMNKTAKRRRDSTCGRSDSRCPIHPAPIANYVDGPHVASDGFCLSKSVGNKFRGWGGGAEETTPTSHRAREKEFENVRG